MTSGAEQRIRIRRAAERGRTRLDWLDGRHSFSFGGYVDPAWDRFSILRVLNDDRIAPGGGFPTHPHRDMEILTYVLSGELSHRDSLGNGSVIRPGEIQRMSAGTGILHSEFNASKGEPLRLLQIWLFPFRKGLPPGYAQKRFDGAIRPGEPLLIASVDGGPAAVTISADVRAYALRLPAGSKAELPLPHGRKGWLQVATGAVRLGAETLSEGDGAGLSAPPGAPLEGLEASEGVFFDLP